VTSSPLDINLPRNADVALGYQLVGADNLPVSLTGITGMAASVRDIPDGTVIGSGAVAITDAANGKVEVRFNGAAFSAYGDDFTTAQAVWNLTGNWPDGTTQEVFRAYLYLLPEI
jgi:hypothetical protein